MRWVYVSLQIRQDKVTWGDAWGSHPKLIISSHFLQHGATDFDQAFSAYTDPPFPVSVSICFALPACLFVCLSVI